MEGFGAKAFSKSVQNRLARFRQAGPVSHAEKFGARCEVRG